MSGQTSKNITSLNMAIYHTGTFVDLANALQNGDVRLFNKAKNELANQFGDPGLNNLKMSSQAVGEELMRVFRQVNASESEAKMFMERLGDSSSPEQIKGAAGTTVSLLKGRLDSLDEQWKRAMGPDKTFPDLLSPRTKAIFDRLAPLAATSAAPQAGSGWSIRPK